MAAASSSPRRNGLWAEIALALALITLSTILLNAGVFWLLLKHAEEERRTDLVLSLSGALQAQLEVALKEQGEAGVRQVLAAYRASGLEVDELYVASPSMTMLGSLAGSPPQVPDAGLRAALSGKKQFASVEGVLWGRRWVVVTTPISPRGGVDAVLRVKMPLKAPGVPGGPAGFVLLYTAFSGFAIALFGFDLFRRRLLRPIEALREGTTRIAGGDFGHQLRLDAARELEALCASLNTMSASLADYRARTAEQVRHLESANTELQRAQDALVRAEKLAGIGRLAAGIAHEVGNPLSAILGYVELLSSGLGEPALEADLLARVQRELGRIDGIIRSLLDYARIGAGRAEAVPLRAALEGAAAIVRMRPELRGLPLTCTVEVGADTAWIEADKLHQILLNLLINAGQAAGSAGQVWLSALPHPEGVEVRVEDSGPGFSAIARERLFEPFFTTKDVGEGTGMGLATCQQLVETARGQILIEDRPEGGARVRVILPTAPPSLPGEEEG